MRQKSKPLGKILYLWDCSSYVTQNRRLRSFFRNDWIALSVNSCGKLFHIDNNAVFSSGSAMLVGFGVCSIPVSHSH